MDLNGERRRTPLIEEPRRPPWLLIAAAALAILGLVWAASNLDMRFERPATPEVAADQGVEPGAPVSSSSARPPLAYDGLPKWVTEPVAEFPEEAAGQPTGRVRLICLIQPDHTLDGCRILEETPVGYGFGRNAVEAARQATVTADSPVDAQVNFTIQYGPASD